MAKALFITGTGTDVGKTHIAGLLLKALLRQGIKTAYYKAAMSGNRRNGSGELIPGDALAVQKLAHTTQPLASMCPYVYEDAVSPHLAARWAEEEPKMAQILAGYDTLRASYHTVLVEGSGGILCPLWVEKKAHLFLTDFIQARALPCLIVADSGLGTINATGLTAAYLRSLSIPIAGLIFNRYDAKNPMHLDNLQVCQSITDVPVLACVPDGATDLVLSPALTKILDPAMEV